MDVDAFQHNKNGEGGKSKGGKGKDSKDKDKPSKPGGSAAGAKKPDVECYNCGKKGHYARDCWSKPRTDKAKGS
eukprot:6462928-Amphidinium_carterae.2